MSALVLASTSRYRRELLARLGLPFRTRSPGVDETARPAEAPAELAARLAAAKARSAARAGELVIGSDQVASLEGAILRKPGDHETALRQLRACQGKVVDFHTAAAIVEHGTNRAWQTVDHTRVHFATLDAAELEAYLRAEEPYDCAGSFKAEGLGIALFSRIDSTDPTALMGLPLIWVAATLRGAGLDPFRGPRRAP